MAAIPVRKDKRLGLAVLGAELVYAGVFNRADQNYTNPKLKKMLRVFEKLDAGSLRSKSKNCDFLTGVSYLLNYVEKATKTVASKLTNWDLQ